MNKNKKIEKLVNKQRKKVVLKRQEGMERGNYGS